MFKKCMDKVYDAAICAFSVVDIICDVCVTLQFHTNGHMMFFWISIFILSLAQICYAVIICLSVEPIIPVHLKGKRRNRHRMQKYILLFFMALPFGQLVPLWLMFANAFPSYADKFYKALGYRNIFNDMGKGLFQIQSTKTIKKVKTMYGTVNEPVDDVQSENDPLSLYIRSKCMSHLGFIIEAIIEAIPQSILQMVFLILYASNSESVSWLNLISILMSMIVVTSKGTILSYSIYRSAAIFNFLCFAIDIFGIFTVVSWLFIANPENEHEHDSAAIFDADFHGYKMWNASYYYFNFLETIVKLVIAGAIGGICLGIHDGYRIHHNHPWRNWVDIIFVGAIGALLFFPIFLVCLMIRFTLLPLLVLRSFDHSQNKSYAFYDKLFTFLTDSKSISEMHEKLLLSNWMFAKIICGGSSFTGKSGNPYRNTNVYSLEYNCRQIQMHYEDTSNMSLSVIYSQFGWTGAHKYHQIIEVLQLLFSRSGLWAFLFVKIMFFLQLKSKIIVKFFYHCLRFMYVPLNIDDVSFLWSKDNATNHFQNKKFVQLEADFYETIAELQNITKWHEFTDNVRQVINNFLSFNYKELWQEIIRNLKREWRIFRDNYSNEYVVAQTKNGLHWFFIEGLYAAIRQEIINVLITFGFSYKGHRQRVQLMRWNIPKCWKSFAVMFDEAGRKNYAYLESKPTWTTYKYDTDNPWIGRGLFVFFVVILYKCIHRPLRAIIGGKVFESVFHCLVLLAWVATIITLLLLAIYSVFLPIAFLVLHCYHFGIFNFEQNTLQIVLTMFYLCILSGIMALFSKVWKFVYCDIHLIRFFGRTKSTPVKYADFVIDTYKAAPIRNEIVLNRFGADIGGLILRFLPKWHFYDNCPDDGLKAKFD